MNTHRGPPQALHQQPCQDNDETQNDSETLAKNQCIFLCSFYVKDRLWGPQVMKAGAGYHDPGKNSPEEEGPEGVLSDGDVTVESLLPSTQVSSQTFLYLIDGNFCYRARVLCQFSSITCWRWISNFSWHLNQVLNLYQESDANVVIANDSDLWPYLGVILMSASFMRFRD